MAKGDLVKQFLTEEELKLISEKIGQIEKKTSGEVRVVIREHKDWIAKLVRLSIRRMAVEEFYRLKMHKTRDRTGVILYFLLEDRQFYIYGDRGIHDKLGQGMWDGLCNEMSKIAKEKSLYDAIIYGLEKIGAKLAEHFPVKPDDVNELPNDVAIR